PALVPEVFAELTNDCRSSVRPEARGLRRVVPVDGLDQAHRRYLGEVLDRLTTARKAPRDPAREWQPHLDRARTQALAVGVCPGQGVRLSQQAADRIASAVRVNAMVAAGEPGSRRRTGSVVVHTQAVETVLGREQALDLRAGIDHPQLVAAGG